MLMPAKTKYKKMQKGRVRGKAHKGSRIEFGEFGMQVAKCGFITARQIEAARVSINREIKRGGKIWIRIFPYKPLTKKPAETRMGKGKGSVEAWVAPVKAGRILFELGGVGEDLARKAFELAGHKLPLKIKFKKRQ